MRNFEDFIKLNNMIGDFCRRNKEVSHKYLLDLALERRLYMDDNSFFIYSVDGDEMTVHYPYVKKGYDLSKLVDKADEICRELKLKKMSVLTTKPKALERLFGFKYHQTLISREVDYGEPEDNINSDIPTVHGRDV